LQCKEADRRQQITVSATADSHLELIRAAPDFTRLDEMLQVPFSGGDGTLTTAQVFGITPGLSAVCGARMKSTAPL
jgi:hypothetical protein